MIDNSIWGTTRKINNYSAHSGKDASILDGPCSQMPQACKTEWLNEDAWALDNEATDILAGGRSDKVYPTPQCKSWGYEEQIRYRIYAGYSEQLWRTLENSSVAPLHLVPNALFSTPGMTSELSHQEAVICSPLKIKKKVLPTALLLSASQTNLPYSYHVVWI